MAGNSSDRLEDLQFKREQARLGGGLKRQEAIRSSGRGTARDRINMLIDEGSFIELDSFVTHRTTDNGMFLHHTIGDGVVAGHGTINGRRIYCFAQDFSVHGGSMGEMHAKKIAKLVDMAKRVKAPIIGLWDGGGQRAHDGVAALAGTGELLDQLVQCSGRVPMISLVLGPVVGVSALAASLADFTILGEEHGQLFLSSPLETPEVIEGEVHDVHNYKWQTICSGQNKTLVANKCSRHAGRDYRCWSKAGYADDAIDSIFDNQSHT